MTELTLTTHCAHWGSRDHRYFGYAVFDELLGQETFTGLTVLGVLGRRLPAEHYAVIDDAAVALTLADPRIWPIKLTRLLASYGSPMLAAAGGMLALDRARIGSSVTEHAARLLVDLRERLADRLDDPERVRAVALAVSEKQRFLPGFGTPFRAEDERLIALRKSLARRGRAHLPHFLVLEAVAPVLSELTGAQPNIALGVAACFLDLGLAVSEVAPLTTALLHHMFVANALESSAQAPPWLRELPEHTVKYLGPAPRKSPRALAAEGLAPPSTSSNEATLPRPDHPSVAPPSR
jgi:hypothetical protein